MRGIQPPEEVTCDLNDNHQGDGPMVHRLAWTLAQQDLGEGTLKHGDSSRSVRYHSCLYITEWRSGKSLFAVLGVK